MRVGGLPKRTRNHELEDLSRKQFERQLPAHWIYRTKGSDYGIDGEVEIVSSQGELFGRVFYVQLKATNIRNVRQALKVRIQRTTFNYYLGLELPVLIVLFHAPSGRLFARWFYECEFPTRQIPERRVTLELKETDVWTLKTPNRLSFEIEGFRQVRNPAYWTPFDLSLVFQGGIEDDRFRRDVLLALSHSATSSRLFRLVPPGNATHVTITVATELTVIDVARVSQFRFPTRSGTADAPATFVSNMLFGLAMAFQNAGRVDVAAQLILTFGQDAPLIKQWEWGVRAAECLASSNHVTQAVRMARALATSAHGMTAAAAVGLSGILSSRVLSPDEYEDLKSLWLLLSNQRDRASDKVFTSRAHYNLGNLLRSGGEFRSAATQYLLAARRDPVYYKRQGYFWSELGGGFLWLK